MYGIHYLLSQPLSVDNALSTIEVIHKVVTQINELTKAVAEIDSKANEYTDEEINKLNNQLTNYINSIKSDIENSIVIIQNDILNNSSDINELESEFSILENSFNDLTLQFVEFKVEVNERLNNSINGLKSYIDLQIEIIKELIKAQNPKIINRYGYIENIQNAYNSLIDSFNKFIGCVTFNKFINFFQNYSFVNGSTTYDFANITFSDYVNKFGIYERQLSDFTVTLSTGAEITIDARVRKTHTSGNYLSYNDMINNYYLEFIIMCLYLGNSLGSSTPTFWRDLSFKMFEENYSRASLIAMYSI